MKKVNLKLSWDNTILVLFKLLINIIQNYIRLKNNIIQCSQFSYFQDTFEQ